jgi:hypothetical protein
MIQSAIKDSAEYASNNFLDAMIFSDRKDLWKYCLSKGTNISNGMILEFGVWKGESINFFARNCPEASIFGFDSFEGLEEDWHGFTMQKGSFDLHGKLPKVEKNVTLLKGWFEETLPDFLQKLEDRQIGLLHLDADTYKPTAFVLSTLGKNLRRGTIIIFDEYFGYPNFRLHEFRAWKEYSETTDIRYKYIGYTNHQVAIEIL